MLDPGIPQSDPHLHDILDAHRRSLIEVQLPDTEADVRKKILTCMKSGGTGPDHMASMLGTRERTLQRGLMLAGTPLAALLCSLAPAMPTSRLAQNEGSVSVPWYLYFSRLRLFSLNLTQGHRAYHSCLLPP